MIHLYVVISSESTSIFKTSETFYDVFHVPWEFHVKLDLELEIVHLQIFFVCMLNAWRAK